VEKRLHRMSKTIDDGFESCSISLDMGESRVGEKERFISSKISKYIEFWKLWMLKDDSYSRVMGPYVKYWENIAIIKTYPMIILFCWKAFGLLAIGELIMSTHPFILLLMLTLKILSSLHTMGLETCAFL
jgi:hypothetical protein